MILTVAAMAVLTSVGACGSDDEIGTPPLGDGIVARGLAALPSSVWSDDPSERGATEVVEIRIGDLTSATRAAGLERPDRDDHQAVFTWLAQLGAGRPLDRPDESPVIHVALPQLFAPAGLVDPGAFEDELGWNPADVAWFAEYLAPPEVVTVLAGDFPAERLDATMGPARDGVWALGPADGEINLEDRTPVRRLGESLRLAGGGERLAVARTTAAVRAASPLGADDATLADDPTAALLAEVLDESGVVAASLWMGASFDLLSFGGADDAVLPERFVALGTGIATDSTGLVAVVAHLHPDITAASSNAAALRRIVDEEVSLSSGRPWSELLRGDVTITIGTETDASAPVIVTRIPLASDVPPSIIYEAVLRRDGIVAHR